MLMLNLIATTILTSATVATNAIDEVQINFDSSVNPDFPGSVSLQLSARVAPDGGAEIPGANNRNFGSFDPAVIHIKTVQISLDAGKLQIQNCHATDLQAQTSENLVLASSYIGFDAVCDLVQNGNAISQTPVAMFLAINSYSGDNSLYGDFGVWVESQPTDTVYEFQVLPTQKLLWFGDCAGDVNGDGKVDVFDLTMLHANYNKSVRTGNIVEGDLNGDGIVNFADLLQFAQNNGRVCNPWASQ